MVWAGPGFKLDLVPGHILLDGVLAPRETGKQTPLFSADVYCGHGRPSQLLLSSCYISKEIVISQQRFNRSP